MKLINTKSLIALILVGCLLWFGIVRYRSHKACKLRAEALTARVESLRRDAEKRLTIGAKKEDVIRFFSESNIPLSFDPISGASGTIYTTGCSPFGCGADSALIGVRVPVDSTGTVQSKPVVVGMYTDCL